MNPKGIIWFGVMVIVAASCSSGGTEATTTVIPPSTIATTAAPAPTTTTTTMPPPTTTTTTTRPPPTTTAAPVFAWDGDVDALTSPLVHLDGFRFEISMFDETADGPEGLFVSGTYVAPQTASCTVANPALFTPTLGTYTIYQDLGWFDDEGFFEPDGRERSEFADDLRFCPSTSEFWDQPVWMSDHFLLESTDEMEEIDGVETRRIEIGGGSDTVDVDEGTMWVTSDGWPIRVTIEATITGGMGRLQGSDEIGEEPVDISIEYELTDIDAAALAIRAPDGVLLAGPIGTVEPNVAALPRLEGRLETVRRFARASNCRSENTLRLLLGDYTLDELDFATIRGITAEDDEGLIVINSFLGLPRDIGQTMTTTAGGEAATIHALLYFRDIAPFVAISNWMGFVPDPWIDPDSDGLKIEVVATLPSADGGTAGPLVIWDGLTMQWSEPVSIVGGPKMEIYELDYFAFLRSTDEALELTEDEVFETRAWMALWIAEVVDALEGVPSADFQALANLKALAEDFEQVELMACALLGTAFVRAADALAADESSEVVLGAFADEIAAQNLLLFLEYVSVIVDYLERPEVDWLEGEDVDLTTGIGVGNTDAAFMQFLTMAALLLPDIMTPEGMRGEVGF